MAGASHVYIESSHYSQSKHRTNGAYTCCKINVPSVYSKILGTIILLRSIVISYIYQRNIWWKITGNKSLANHLPSSQFNIRTLIGQTIIYIGHWFGGVIFPIFIKVNILKPGTYFFPILINFPTSIRQWLRL